MKQIIQNLSSGETSLIDVPTPSIQKGCLLIKTAKSLISPGTEMMLVDFGKANLVSKAKQQPEKVKQVISKVKNDGISATYEAVMSKLHEPISLGYSNVGEVIGVGDGVNEFSIGDRVVSNGNHAEVVSVPSKLCALIPDNVSNEEASFTILGAIGLQGIRLAKPTLGEKFVVFGLGVIGLLTAQILKANGCDVLAIDLDEERIEVAKKLGIQSIRPGKECNILDYAKNFSNQLGVDGVIITASTSDNKLISQAASMSRKRGRIILIGVVGLDLSRDDFYKKEITFQVSCSYGPGRYEQNYEERGMDYPIGFVRWTEQRNFCAVLDLIDKSKIDVNKLISHRLRLNKTPDFYKGMSSNGGVLGVIIEYSDIPSTNNERKVSIKQLPKSLNDKPVVSFIGSGNYASRVLMPAFKNASVNLNTVVTSGGLSGSIHGKKNGFEYSSTDLDEVLEDDLTDAVVIVTRHNLHSELVCKTLLANKSVFVEKPLAITRDGLEAIKNAYENHINLNLSTTNKHLMVGYNRRFSPHIGKIKSLLANTNEPKSFVMTINAGYIPHDHWVHDPHIGGGRVLGEACHFIDLMRFLADSKISHTKVQKMSGKKSEKYSDDNVVIILGFEDGSIGTINYLSNGSNSYPKEKIEIFTSGKVLYLDNFRILKGYGWKNFNKIKNWKQNKGNENCVKAFVNSLKTGEELIPIDEIFEVASASLDIAEQIRNQP